MAYDIVVLQADLFPAFAAYMDDHLRDNGIGNTSLFQPLAAADCRFDVDRAERFSSALCASTDGPGWRRAWVAMNNAGAVVGHVDLRDTPLPYTRHRCLLGMGVDRHHRGAGLGRQLLETATKWAIGRGWIDWIDLQVISSNAPAVRLYEKAGFVQTGSTSDLFRFDQRSVDSNSMSLRLKPSPDA
ncbi:GNAT family N-acetyltransferase [Paucibacter sp. PLA-PC-4]|uniref:GNAT family N-acetyltransferase n=1 Tax=Paucibacter sp. PLA-PC-4 TaxID=2993655 RepID=UPI002248FFE8|nr:GNAT family N-acetyltransferase [Paucibacter sp. PLA-PC-4]MCX2861005.1 GNAT family N-acetyltransferase [Paucibacter sp. PLA-PC-4]